MMFSMLKFLSCLSPCFTCQGTSPPFNTLIFFPGISETQGYEDRCNYQSTIQRTLLVKRDALPAFICTARTSLLIFLSSPLTRSILLVYSGEGDVCVGGGEWWCSLCVWIFLKAQTKKKKSSTTCTPEYRDLLYLSICASKCLQHLLYKLLVTRFSGP